MRFGYDWVIRQSSRFRKTNKPERSTVQEDVRSIDCGALGVMNEERHDASGLLIRVPAMIDQDTGTASRSRILMDSMSASSMSHIIDGVRFS